MCLVGPLDLVEPDEAHNGLIDQITCRQRAVAFRPKKRRGNLVQFAVEKREKPVPSDEIPFPPSGKQALGFQSVRIRHVRILSQFEGLDHTARSKSKRKNF